MINNVINYRYTKGVQKFMKEAGMISYPNTKIAFSGTEQTLMPEEVDASAIAGAMGEHGAQVPAEEKTNDQVVLDIANTLLDLAKEENPATASKMEEAAQDLAGSVPPAGAEQAMDAAKTAASRVASAIKRKIAADETTPKPDQVLDLSKKDYNKGLGNTTLNTAKGEIGKQENVEDKIVQKEAPNADGHQKEEGKDIFAKDYEQGLGKTTLKTEKGIIGSETAVPMPKAASEETAKKLASLSLQQILAKINGK